MYLHPFSLFVNFLWTDSSGTSHEVGWEDRLQYDLFSVEPDIKP